MGTQKEWVGHRPQQSDKPTQAASLLDAHLVCFSLYDTIIVYSHGGVFAREWSNPSGASFKYVEHYPVFIAYIP